MAVREKNRAFRGLTVPSAYMRIGKGTVRQEWITSTVLGWRGDLEVFPDKASAKDQELRIPAISDEERASLSPKELDQRVSMQSVTVIYASPLETVPGPRVPYQKGKDPVEQLYAKLKEENPGLTDD